MTPCIVLHDGWERRAPATEPPLSTHSYGNRPLCYSGATRLAKRGRALDTGRHSLHDDVSIIFSYESAAGAWQGGPHARQASKNRQPGAGKGPAGLCCLHVAILVARLVLLERLPVIAEDLLEGVFVDPLPCGGHRARLYHVLGTEASRFFTLLSPLYLSPPQEGRAEYGIWKKEILIRCT